MPELVHWLQYTELDRVAAAELAERISEAEKQPLENRPRQYPGYPIWPLPRKRNRWRPAFDTVLRHRRCCRRMVRALPTANQLGHLLESAHGVADPYNRGSTPSAGNLQALEIYLVHWQTDWLPCGVYHYDRRRNHLSQISTHADESHWKQLIPSLWQIDGGGLIWVLIGDLRRVAGKYGERGERFLLLEAGHLMQNLCLASDSLGLCTVPLGGCLEQEISRELVLPAEDRVLYVGVCGAPETGSA